MSQPRISPVPMPSMKPGPSRYAQLWRATSHDREEAEQADSDEGALHEASGNVAEGQGFVLPLEQWEQHDGTADVGNDEEQFEERPQEHAGVGASTVDVVGIAQDRSVGEGPGNRGDEREDEQHSYDERGLPR